MAENKQQSAVNQAVADGGSYEVIRKRLEEQGKALSSDISALNAKREDTFGKTLLDVIDRVRVRTENNCQPRDIVRINGQLLFGYNVFIGLRKTTAVSDVFALYELVEKDGKYDVVESGLKGSFLDEPRFTKDFTDLYSYYKNTNLIQLRVVNEKLLAAFQIGEKIHDIRVFRWQLGSDNSISYIDDRGERDIELPPSYDFEWHCTGRENFVQGRHPHVSILDEVFVETVNGDLTIKIEDNTEDGQGIYREPVEDKHQSLDDGEIHYAEVGTLILLKILPYNETHWRHFVFSRRTHSVTRIDAIEHSCVQLPEEHGIVFPGGYFLQSGEYKLFSEPTDGLRFKRRIVSPNGEDVLFVFYERHEGLLALFSYNLITKQLQNPIFAHGYSLFDDGRMVIFRAESDEPTRIHPMQVWQTPYTTDEFSDSQPKTESALGTIGNAELVKGISELNAIVKLIDEQKASVAVYEVLIKSIQRLLDGYFWLSSDEIGNFASQLKKIGQTAELVLDEFEKVESIGNQSKQALRVAENDINALIRRVHVENFDAPAPFVDGLLSLKRQKGLLNTLKDYRYIDLERIIELEQTVDEEIVELGKKALKFLSTDSAMTHYENLVDQSYERISRVEVARELNAELELLEETSEGLDALTEVINGLNIDDTTGKTAILESVSTVYSRINQTRAHAKLTAKELSNTESIAEFGAQLAVLSQAITSALSASDTPTECDTQLARLLVHLEELESNFSDNEEFLAEILTKRQELYEAFETHKQSLLDQRQRRAQSILSAANRVLESIERRALRFTDATDLNTYFSSDPMVLKVSALALQLRELDDNVKADDVESKLKSTKEQAIRSLRDKSDIFEDGGNVINLGKHKFSVNTQPLDLTLLPRDGKQVLHLTGTDFYQELETDELDQLKQFWDQTLSSEPNYIYRGEYLAYSIFLDALEQSGELSFAQLVEAALKPEQLHKLTRDYANVRYREGYEKGVHDADAAAILVGLVGTWRDAGLLAYSPDARGLAMIYWQSLQDEHTRKTLQTEAVSAHNLRIALGSERSYQALAGRIGEQVRDFAQRELLDCDDYLASQAGQFLVSHLMTETKAFAVSAGASALADKLHGQLEKNHHKQRFVDSLDSQVSLRDQIDLCQHWLTALITRNELDGVDRFVLEAASLLIFDKSLKVTKASVDLSVSATELLGEHRNIQDRKLEFQLDEFLDRLGRYRTEVLPEYQRYSQLRKTVIEQERARIDLESFKARPLASFVRNRLINESYLPIIGDNLAKQMGTVGSEKRSDLMGLLMLISPPGYGKTTLMEYVSNRLGLNFMKINCPSLGHDVKSLDPMTAPSATARQELEKLNLALEMGNNVMLYLDDIQHTHPEFLQKFISLCDGTRRIEGVWGGDTKTYDMRGKKFCVIMAGNPYTESGEVFRVPDMLANRADVYNLGDILGGQQDIFALSYIENSLTSNKVLAPLALRDLNDLYLFVAMAKGKEVATSEFSHSYSGVESNEIIRVLQKMLAAQEVILAVNQEYIRSAATDDRYREEPPFLLQGSYRNMNKLAEKIVPVMDDDELEQLIDDHFVGEAQLLTTGAEENLLKLKALRNTLSEAEAARWESIKSEFKRRNSLDGEADAATRIASQIAQLREQLVIASSDSESRRGEERVALESKLSEIGKALQGLNMDVSVVNEPLPGLDSALESLAQTMETSFVPVVVAMNKKIDVSMQVLEEVTNLSGKIKALSQKSTRKSVSKQTVTQEKPLAKPSKSVTKKTKPKAPGAKAKKKPSE